MPNEATDSKPRPKPTIRARVHRILRRIFLVNTALAGLLIGWLYVSGRATGFDDAVLRSDDRVVVEVGDAGLTFRPRGEADRSRAGLIFFPGAQVEPAAYAPLARSLAALGFPATIVQIPFAPPPFGPDEEALLDRADRLIQADPSVERWVVAGHSRGGALAARYAHDRPGRVAGLVLVGTSHPKSPQRDLSGSGLDVTRVYATEDGLATVARVEANRRLLPPDTRWVRVEGGNHAQFGWYGAQLGDGRATIPREEQQAILLEAVRDALRRAAAGP